MSYNGAEDAKLPQQNQMQAQPLILKEDDKIPLFLVKLWNIVEDPAYYEVIRWDESGYSFHILDPYSFCRNVLPQYFKHNNLNSLIRQLNMYGFRKMTPIERTSLARAESDQDHLEFSHPCFVRDHAELLVNIKRKAPTARQNNNDGTVSVPAKDLTAVFEELRSLRERQKQMESRMGDLVKENELIWQEMGHMRGAHVKQQQIVTKLVQFMVAMLQPSKRLGKRHILAIDENQAKRSRTSPDVPQVQQGNVAEVLDRLIRDYASSMTNSNVANQPGVSQQRQVARPANNGPIIADVTDEMDHLGTPSGPKLPAPSGATLYNQDQYRQPRYYQQQVQSNPGARMPAVGLPSQQQRLQPTSQIPQNLLLQGSGQVRQQPHLAPQQVAYPELTGKEIREALSTPTSPHVQQPASSSTVAANDDPLINSPSAANLNLSTAELTEYLNSVDQSIDNCRDLIGGHWDDLDLDGLLDFEKHRDVSTTSTSPDLDAQSGSYHPDGSIF